MTGPAYTYRNAIARACEILVHAPDPSRAAISMHHRTYVHAWAQDHFTPDARDRTDIEATIYAAGSLLLFDSPTVHDIDVSVKAIIAVEHNSVVTNALAVMLSQRFVKLSANLAPELEHALHRAVQQSKRASFLHRIVQAPSTESLPNAPERCRQLSQTLDYLPDIAVMTTARLLFALDRQRYINSLCTETDELCIIERLSALRLEDAFDVASRCNDRSLREIVLVRWTVERECIIDEKVVATCLRVSLTDPKEWRDRLDTFAAWPLYPGHDRLMKPLGRTLSDADDAQLDQFFDIIPFDLPGQSSRGRMSLILDGIETQGGTDACRRFCAKAYAKWHTWVHAPTTQTFYPPASWLDLAAERHIRMSMSLPDRATAVSDLRAGAVAADQRHGVDAQENYYAHMRYIAAYQPFARADADGLCDAGLKTRCLSLHLDLMDSGDIDFFNLRYNYQRASDSWKRIVRL